RRRRSSPSCSARRPETLGPTVTASPSARERAILRGVSPENEEIARGVWPNSIDMVEFLRAGAPLPSDQAARIHPEIEIEFATSSPGVPPLHYRGADGFIEGWSDWLTPF